MSRELDRAGKRGGMESTMVSGEKGGWVNSEGKERGGV